MAVPSNRVPVRVARGLKSALVSNLANLLEGELLYAKDEDKLYMVENGALVAMGADLAASSIGDLSDVTLTSASTGEVLRYNGTAWVDAQLAYSDLSGTPTLATVATSGAYNDLTGKPTLGTAAAAATTDFATAAQGTKADSALQGTSSINALADVDTATATPTTGQVLEWNGTNWVPANAGGAVDSVNGQTGVVLLDLEDLENVKPIGGTVYFYNNFVNSSGNVNSAGKYYKQGFVSPDRELVYVWGTDANGNDISTQVAGATTGTSIWWKSDTVTTWQASTLYSNATGSGPTATCIFSINEPPAVATGGIGVGNIYLTFVDPLSGPSDGQVLTWVAANDQWEPATPAAGGVTQIIAGTNVTIDPVGGTGAVTINATGGGGGGTSPVAGTVYRVSETQTASGGIATFAGIGQSGLLVQATSNIDAWVALYPTAAARTADAGRAYGTDPLAGSGVLAEFWIPAGTTVLASPGTWYFNNDTTVSHAVYAAVRNQAGASVGAAVTITAYKHETGGIGGTSRLEDTVLASGGTASFAGIGVAGQFVSVASDIDAWITFYGTAADRTSDSGRAFGTDPVAGDGVQADIFVGAGTTVLMTPGMGYFNNDATYTEVIYAAVRDTAGVAANATVTVRAFGQGTISSISGGTFGSG